MNAPTSHANTDDWHRLWSENATNNALNPAQAYRRTQGWRLLAVAREPGNRAERSRATAEPS